MVSPQDITIKYALLLKISKNCCGLRNPQPQTSIASKYIPIKAQIVMVRSKVVLETVSP
jgi:hypothetical protein